MNGAPSYASITHSSSSPPATTRPTSPTPADGRIPAASSPPSPASSAPRPAATEPVTSAAPPHDLSSAPVALGFGDRAGPAVEAIRLARTTRQPDRETREPHLSH